MISSNDMSHILGLMQAAGIQELTVREGTQRLRLVLETSPDAVRATEIKTQSAQHQILSPGPGRFLASHPRRPGSKVESGDQITTGQIVGYLATNNTLTAIIANGSGTVAEVLASDGDLLGYASPVLTIEGSTESCA